MDCSPPGSSVHGIFQARVLEWVAIAFRFFLNWSLGLEIWIDSFLIFFILFFVRESDMTERLHFHTLEKGMAPHSSVLAWRVLGKGEPGGLQSMGSGRVRHDWATSLSLFTFMHRGRKWQPTPVFLPGESQGQGSLVGCRLWGRTESDKTEAT